MATVQRSSDRAGEGSALDLVLRRPALAAAIIISTVMCFGLIGQSIVKATFATDFGVYWRTANGTPAEAYLPRSSLPFPYAPTMMIWVAPLALVPLWIAYFGWVAASVALLWKACRRHLSPAESTMVLLSPPLINGLATGQVSAALTALLLWSTATPNRIAAGVAFGIVASIKPQLVVLAPLMLLLNKDWRAIAVAAATFAGLIAASIMIFGSERWVEWVDSMGNFRSVLHDHNVLGVAITPAAAAENYGLPASPFLVLGIGLGLWLVWRCRNLPPVGKCGAIACGSLLAAPYALTYDLAPIMPFLVWSIFRGSVSSALAIAGALNPLPLLLAALNLARSTDLGTRPAEPA